MATQITVAVGANGEVTRAHALRDGARADRLDSEATRQQARKAVGESLDDDAPGRDSLKSNYGPSRDPAAHARKKPAHGGFSGFQIQYRHYRLENLKWEELRDAKYMDITVRPINNEGLIAGPTVIELTRNLVTDTFCKPIPANHEFIEIYDDDYGSWNKAAWWPPDPNWQFGYNAARYIYGPKDAVNWWPVQAGGVYTTESGAVYMRYFSQGSLVGFSCMDPRDNSVTVSPYHIASDPNENPQSLDDLTGFPADGANHNIKINGRTQLDERVTSWLDHHKDPVHELFLLPYTGETTFLLVIYSDYLIKTRAFMQQTGLCQSAFNGDVYYGTYRIECTTVDYTRYRPTWHIPDGYEFPKTKEPGWTDGGYDQPYDAIITEEGANKIQTIKLYKITNGVMDEIEEIPQKLRERADNLSSSFKDKPIRGKGQNAWRQTTTGNQSKAFFGGTYGDDVFTTGTPVEGDGWRMYWPMCAFMNNELIDTYLQRKYLDSETDERSIAKGYGIGNITRTNHFNSRYLNTGLHGFYDDFYFTPMVYQYLKGSAECTKLYARVDQSITVKPEFFVDVYHASSDGTVDFYRDRPVNIEQPAGEDRLGSEETPGLKNATHICWNWNRPDHCWDELTALGFSQQLLGPRPENQD